MSSEISAFETNKIQYRNKAIDIIECVNKKEIDIDELRKLAFTGVPGDVRGLRPMVWRIILGALPSNTSEWP